MVGAVIVAAGSGARMGGVDKAFIQLAGRPAVAYSLLAIAGCPEIGAISLVVREPLLGKAREIARSLGLDDRVAVVAGGAERSDSVLAGLDALPDAADLAVIHDAARPLVTSDLVSACIESARRHGSGVAARRSTDTLKECNPDSAEVLRTLNRSRIWAVQTPQVFAAARLRDALRRVAAERLPATDDASAIELCGGEVRLVEWNAPNFKLTFPEDVAVAEALLGARAAARKD